MIELTAGPGARLSSGPSTHYRVYGITLSTAFRFANRLPLTADPPDMTFRCAVDGRAGAGEPPGRLLWADTLLVDGEPAVTLWGSTPDLVLRFLGISDFHLLLDRIECFVAHPDHAYLLEIQLLGMVLALWLEQRGTLVLHASAVEVGGQVVAFLGPKGMGKTSMAAAFLAQGATLVTEDLLALQTGPTDVVAHPGYAQMRMWPEQARQFAGELGPLPLVHPRFTKLRVPVGPDGFGTFSGQSQPLSRLYVLERTAGPLRRGVHLTNMTESESIRALIGGSFAPEAVHAMGLNAARLGRLVQVVAMVPLRRLRYPSGDLALTEVLHAVEDDLRDAR